MSCPELGTGVYMSYMFWICCLSRAAWQGIVRLVSYLEKRMTGIGGKRRYKDPSATSATNFGLPRGVFQDLAQ